MHFSLLQSHISQPKSEADYKKATFEFDTKEINSIYQIELHKQAGEMISSTLTNTALSLSKLQVSLEMYNHS